MRITSGMNNGFNSMPMIPGMRNPVLSNGNGATASEQLNRMLVSSARFVVDSRPRAVGLSQTLGTMQNALNSTVAISSNTDIMRIRGNSSTVPEISVKVDQVAEPQRNEGTAMRADDRDMPGGLHSFDIAIDGQTHRVSFTTSEALTNRAFQQRMADAINQANIGITASVNTANNQSTLNLAATATGAGATVTNTVTNEDGEEETVTTTAPRFTITDVMGNATAAMGVNNISQHGQNAIFTVNGETRTSASNNVNLTGGVEATLVSTGEVNVTSGGDATGIRNSVRQMVARFNDLLETARNNGADRNTGRLIRDLENTIRRNRRALDEMGVAMNREGVLVINENRLQTAAENGTAQRLLGGTNNRSGSFVSALTRIADSVAANPVNHISRQISRMPTFNSALSMVANGNTNARQQSTPFDAYFLDDALNSLFNAIR